MRVRWRPERETVAKYLGELVIVAVGVALGLWATQWATDCKDRAEVADARVALDRELALNLESVLLRRQIAPCVERRIADLRQWIVAEPSGHTFAIPAEIGRPGTYTISASVWDVTQAGEVAAKMPLDDRLRYANLYDALATQSRLQMSERDIWFDVGDYAGLAEVPPLELARLRGLVSRAAAFDEALRNNLPRALEMFASLGIKSTHESSGPMLARRAICQPFHSVGSSLG